ncbi:MAG: YkgJ family cysteine cluster protein [Saprospiraceae bacterium]|nr:YkgJ family cysteine cluster protein [Saprospiraceae bacterium]
MQKKLKKIASDKSRSRHQKAEETHTEVFQKFDCLTCANCCKSLPALMSNRDVKRIANHLSLSPQVFKEKFIRVDEDGDNVIDGAPCPFLLDDNRCSIYEVRPAACRQYPHTGGKQFFEHLNLHRKNINHCPALFEIINLLEKQ